MTDTTEISAYEAMAREFDRLAILRKMWSGGEVAAIIRRMAIEDPREALIASQAKRIAELEERLAFAGPFVDERAKQIAKGFTDAHDDEHAKGEILAAALCYLRPHATWRSPAKPANYEAVADAARAGREWYETSTLKKVIDARRGQTPSGWPWEPEAWRPKSEESDLRRAITMLMAEYHRRARARALLNRGEG